MCQGCTLHKSQTSTHTNWDTDTEQYESMSTVTSLLRVATTQGKHRVTREFA